MLLNYSNHPFDTWGNKQKNRALELWGSVSDLNFPVINPNLDEYDLEAIVREEFTKILKLNPSAVHIMGEMNFTFQMAHFLMQNNIPCFASTTNRFVEKKGDNFTSKFEFIDFRKYRFLDIENKFINNQPVALKLSDDQSKILDYFKKFVTKECNTQVLIIKGYAGTGKTTLLKFLHQHLVEIKKHHIIATPTNKARNVIEKKLKKGANISTMHSLIYVFDETIATNNTAWTGGDGAIYQNFNFKAKEKALKIALNLTDDVNVTDLVKDNLIYFFDESSMIKTQVDNTFEVLKFGTGSLLFDFFAVHGTDAKYVFIGDPCQLPPVKENHPAALDANYFEEHFNLKCEVMELTEVKRQSAESGILDMANTLREQIVQQKFYALPQLIFKANYKDVQICLNPNSLLNNYLNHFHKYGEDNCILLSYSNSLVSGYNQNIKNALSNSVSIKEGDVVMSYTKNQLYRVDNSERLVVKKIIESVYQGGVKFLKLRLKSLDNLEEIEAYVYENFLMKNDGSFTNQEFKTMMIDFKKRMDYQNISIKSSEFKEKQKSDPFLNALHLKFGYACTIHKAQGAEWDYVFLAINFNKSNPKYSLENYLNFAKILYTAITRAKKQLFILDGNWILHKF